jgi:hypothetical protein
MGKLLTILGVSQEIQDKLPNDVLEGEQFLNVLQAVYEQAPESKKKDALADAIAENVRLLLQEVAKITIDTVEEQPTPKVEPTPPIEDEPTPEEQPTPDDEPTSESEPTPPSRPTPTSKPTAPKKPKIDKEKERIKKELQEQIDEIRETLSLFSEEEEEYIELQNELDIISEQINQLNN